MNARLGNPSPTAFNLADNLQAYCRVQAASRLLPNLPPAKYLMCFGSPSNTKTSIWRPIAIVCRHRCRKGERDNHLEGLEAPAARRTVYEQHATISSETATGKVYGAGLVCRSYFFCSTKHREGGMNTYASDAAASIEGGNLVKDTRMHTGELTTQIHSASLAVILHATLYRVVLGGDELQRNPTAVPNRPNHEPNSERRRCVARGAVTDFSGTSSEFVTEQIFRVELPSTPFRGTANRTRSTRSSSTAVFRLLQEMFTHLSLFCGRLPSRNTQVMILSSWMRGDGIVGCVIVDVEAIHHLLLNFNPFPVQTTSPGCSMQGSREIGISSVILAIEASLGIAIHNDNTGSLFSSFLQRATGIGDILSRSAARSNVLWLPRRARAARRLLQALVYLRRRGNVLGVMPSDVTANQDKITNSQRYFTDGDPCRRVTLGTIASVQREEVPRTRTLAGTT
ncbi:hypothetical protein C8R43DRAFT_957855 [Mycena crocata]|nr:hypothetical protein C8R43DRAFT_957855 [Mycena crocata]